MAKPIVKFRTKVNNAEMAISSALIDLSFSFEYDDLDSVQQVAHLVMHYDSAVVEGGHLQYFHNRRLQYLSETIASLELISAISKANILRTAIERWNGRERLRARSLVEYHDAELKREFKDLDDAYYASLPGVDELLDVYLEARITLRAMA